MNLVVIKLQQNIVYRIKGPYLPITLYDNKKKMNILTDLFNDVQFVTNSSPRTSLVLLESNSSSIISKLLLSGNVTIKKHVVYHTLSLLVSKRLSSRKSMNHPEITTKKHEKSQLT